jgi:hypothetical protein
MLYDPMNFLHSHATHAAGSAATVLSPALPVYYAPYGLNANGAAAKPWNLFVNNADESIAMAEYSALRIFGGSHERNNPKVIISVQCETIGQSNVNAWTQANGLYRLLCLDNQEHELRMLTLPGFKIADNSADGTWTLVDALTLNTPAQVGRDNRGRIKIVSNFSLGFYKVT